MKIAVVGIGYVGLSNAVLLAQHNDVTAVDIVPEKVEMLNNRQSPIIDADIEHYLTSKALQLSATTDGTEAFKSADYVIVSIRVGGSNINRLELEIPAKYGIIQGVGDTIGPGGVFYALRHIPAVLKNCHDIEELCPTAWLLNYTNPMAMICWAMNDYTTI